MKLRPVLLLTGPLGLIPEILVAYISSVVPVELLETDFLFDPREAGFVSTGLRVCSTLRLHKVATIHGSSLVRLLGLVEQSGMEIVLGKLRGLLGESVLLRQRRGDSCAVLFGLG